MIASSQHIFSFDRETRACMPWDQGPDMTSQVTFLLLSLGSSKSRTAPDSEKDEAEPLTPLNEGRKYTFIKH